MADGSCMEEHRGGNTDLNELSAHATYRYICEAACCGSTPMLCIKRDRDLPCIHKSFHPRFTFLAIYATSPPADALNREQDPRPQDAVPLVAVRARVLGG